MRPMSHGGETHGSEAISHGRDVGEDWAVVAGDAQESKGWQTMASESGGTRGNSVDFAYRGSLGGPTERVSQPFHLLAAFASLGRRRGMAGGVADLPCPAGRESDPGLAGGLSGWELRTRLGATKRGKGTKWMVVVDGQGLPLGSQLTSASPAEVTLAEATLEPIPVEAQPERVITDKAYDSDHLRVALSSRGMELICPHRTNRRRPKTQDGRKLRRYRRRWKIERTFAWLGNFRRLVVRYERHLLMYASFFHLACCLILLRGVMK